MSKPEEQTDDELLAAVKDPAVKELLKRRLRRQSKLEAAARTKLANPSIPLADPRVVHGL